MEENAYRTVSPAEFAALDSGAVTLVDLREPDEVLIGPVDGTLNLPFSKCFSRLDEIPPDKPVYLLCRSGEWSEQIAEILADRGYDAAHLEGGYQALRKYYEGDAGKREPASQITEAEQGFLDAKQMKCPGPIVAVADWLRGKPEGTKLTVEATEEAFWSDIQIWCERTGNHLDGISRKNGIIRAELTRAAAKNSSGEAPGSQTDKTFVIFSGDLDKTIAAFIMANGAAAMGRRVTMFFTFWGLNILRHPKRGAGGKKLAEKLLELMMPRGAGRLGLSRMNLLGAGAKMIRRLMHEKGISSLEDLMENARAHGVHLVACQMSMDIMGIRQEELIDGVELGGVATFLGSGEHSDMSLFI